MQTQACDRCHRRKTKCDRRVPRCSSCEKANTPCVHTDKLNLLPYPRAYINSLEAAVKRLEKENKKLDKEVKKLRSSSNAISSPECIPLTPTPGDSELNCDGGPLPSRNNGESSIAMRDAAGPVEGMEMSPTAVDKQHDPRSTRACVPLARVVYSLVSAGGSASSQINPPCQDEDTQVSGISHVVLPSREEATRAIDAYFYHWHLTFPVLCRPQFVRTVDRIYSEPNFYTENPFDAFVFDMVLGMGFTNFNRQDWSFDSPEKHYMRAISKLNKVMAMNDLPPLQAILFLCQYSIFCVLRDTSANMWHLVGIGIRLCMEMGLHRRSTREDSGAHGMEPGKIFLDLEIRKRTFWCLYNLDRIISVTLGRPVGLRDEDIDITLPTAFNIDELPLEAWVDGVEVTAKLQKTSAFLQLIFIRRLAGTILQNAHCTTANMNLSHEEKYEIQKGLTRDLEAWRADISKIDILLHKDQLPTSSFRSTSWYEIPYHNALLLLYRPSPSFPHAGSPCDTITDHPSISLNHILSSSVSTIYLYAEEQRTRRLNYSWITLHAVFIAGLSYVYSISRIIKETTRRRTSFPPCLEYTQIIGVTRTCSNVLVAINERWATARGSLEIFDRLSSAIIQDAVKAQLNLQNSGACSSTQIDKRPHTPTTDSSHTQRRSEVHLASLPQSQQSHPPPQSPQLPPIPLPSPPPAHLSPPQGQQETSFPSLQNDYAQMDSTISDNNAMYSSMEEPFQTSIAENGFRQFYNSLQSEVPEYLRYPGMIPSEVIRGFSQDWFAGDSMSTIEQPDHTTDMMDLWEIMGLVPSADL